MVIDIGNILIERFSSLSWVDRYTGVVKVISKRTETNKIETFPVSCNASAPIEYTALLPDSSKKSVMYLEDKGIRPTDEDVQGIHMTAGYDLIGWLNMEKIGYKGCSFSGTAIAGILSKIPNNKFNQGFYSQIKIEFLGQYQKNANPFSKYSAFDETKVQYLMNPYDFFALSMEVRFIVNKNCLAE